MKIAPISGRLDQLDKHRPIIDDDPTLIAQFRIASAGGSGCGERFPMSTSTAQNRKTRSRRPGLSRDPNEGDNQRAGLDSGRKVRAPSLLDSN
jgi:hypothetical protein